MNDNTINNHSSPQWVWIRQARNQSHLGLNALPVEKLRSLIFSDELRSVKQGLTLWEALISYDYFEDELNHLLDGCTSLNFQDNLQEDLIDKFENKTHAVYISVFLLQYIISFRNDIQVFSLNLSGVNVDDYKDFLLTKMITMLE